jgi:hypothetical protein
MERYDLADLVRLIATVWPEDRIESYTPTYSQQVALEAGMEGALRSLIRLATLRGWGERALEDYLAEHASEPAGSPQQDAAEPTGDVPGVIPRVSRSPISTTCGSGCGTASATRR